MALQLDDIQDFVFSGYRHLPATGYLFVQLGQREAARRWLRQLVPSVTTAARARINGVVQKPPQALNIAFSWKGLDRLGLGKKALMTFPYEFRDGMAARGKPLDSTHAGSPQNWEWGGPNNVKIHVLLILNATDETQLQALLQQQRNLMKGSAGAQEVGFEWGVRPENRREHFGFADGISQPIIAGAPHAARMAELGREVIQTGEFLLGYRNEFGLLPPTPMVARRDDPRCLLETVPDLPAFKDLGFNGSYLVLCKLHQDVAVFRRYVHSLGRDDEERNLLAAKMVGRWPGGAPLVLAPEQEDEQLGVNAEKNNDFEYMRVDPHGDRCPLNAHIRRSHPRDAQGYDVAASRRASRRHRILRRGVPYGPPLPDGVLTDDGLSRGLLFGAINADIERQFEFIQQAWIDNPKFNGAYQEKDSLLGNNNGSSCAVIPRDPLRRRCAGLSRFVTLRGGEYFFLPSLSALRFLAAETFPPLHPAEAPPPGERAAIRRIEASFLARHDRENPPAGPVARRGAHAKAHGCVRAKFIVEENLPAELRCGVFREPRIFPAWVRFSSSAAVPQSDARRDVRGMAIKLMDVAGDKLLPAEKHATTQDFLLANHPVFFVRDAVEFADFSAALEQGGLLGFFLGRNPRHWRPRAAWLLLRSMFKRRLSPLELRYWSQTPYRLGNNAVKYSARPCQTSRTPLPATGDAMREALREHLATAEARFDFLVQRRADSSRMPLEDATVEWREQSAPWQKVATLYLPAQEFESAAQREFCENLSFTPWHTLPEHAPLGSLNRARRSVYEMISLRRHQRNRAPRVEPKP